jgi:hypothetical protein
LRADHAGRHQILDRAAPAEVGAAPAAEIALGEDPDQATLAASLGPMVATGPLMIS